MKKQENHPHRKNKSKYFLRATPQKTAQNADGHKKNAVHR